MTWIDNIRNKPQKEKMRFIWTAIIIAIIVMVILWIFTSRIGKTGPADTTLFQTIGNGIKDIGKNYSK